MNSVPLSVFRPAASLTTEPEHYIAVVGNQDPRKNIATLLEAFPAFRARMRPCRLVMAGPGRAPRTHPPAVDFVGYLSDEELVALYRGALLVVQPSLYEGFGLPVLEAMACGAPVACADIPVFREVAGNCARYFDPHKPGSIAQVMEQIARDDAVRLDMAKRGPERAAGFSWDATAEKLLRVFKESGA